MVDCPVHISSLAGYHSLVALQFLEGQQGQPLGIKLCDAGYGRDFLIDTEDLRRIMLSQGFLSAIDVVNEYITRAQNMNLILSQIQANHCLQDARNEFLLHVPKTRLQEDQLSNFKHVNS